MSLGGLIFLTILILCIALGFLIFGIVCLVFQVQVNNGTRKAKTPNRLIRTVQFSGDFNAIAPKINDFLISRQFKPQSYGGEEAVYRYGSGFWLPARFIKFSPIPGGILIEAFIIIYGCWENPASGLAGWMVHGHILGAVQDLANFIGWEEHILWQYGNAQGNYPPPPYNAPTKDYNAANQPKTNTTKNETAPVINPDNTTEKTDDGQL